MRSIRTRDWKLIPNLTPDATYTTHIELAPRENKPDNWGTYGESWVRAAASDPMPPPK